MSKKKPNRLVEEYLNKNDIKSVRDAIGTIIYTDMAFKTPDFQDEVDYVVKERGIKELMQEFNPVPQLKSELIKEGVNISDDDFAVSIANLKRNFCKERIEDVKKIGRHLYGATQPEPVNIDKSVTAKSKVSNENRIMIKSKNSRIRHEKIGLIAAIAGVAAVVLIIILIIDKGK